jgi:adenylosuccinate synthase
MQHARIVIGANYGDEGKGITTDYLAQEWAGIVVRFNGGAQAAHTVHRINPYTNDIDRHVFGHFSSASLQGVPTYLGPKFVVNPMYFVKELKELQNLLLSPVVYMHPDCYVTTMFDMLINRIIAKRNQHGTCGAGFNETITRCYDKNMLLRVRDLYHYPEGIIKNIQRFYLPARLYELGLTYQEIETELYDKELDLMYDVTCSSIEEMLKYSWGRDLQCLQNYKNVVFEGAQGLLLDEKLGVFPHVTRSRTGGNNASAIIKEVNEKATVDVYYITRPYLTRHGNGPLDWEEPMPSFVVDETNVENEFQGALRYAPLALQSFANRINSDFNYNFLGLNSSKNTMVTCMDQMREFILYIRKGFNVYNKTEFYELIKNCTNSSSVLMSYSKVTPKLML